MKPVWIVDDDRSIRWVIEKALSREGIAFNSFSSAQDALDALSGGSPEVLVSDIRMPGLSGLELLNAVKQRHPAVNLSETGELCNKCKQPAPYTARFCPRCGQKQRWAELS